MGFSENIGSKVTRESRPNTQAGTLNGRIGCRPSATEHKALGKELFIRQGMMGDGKDLIKGRVTDAEDIQSKKGHVGRLSLLPVR
jgi:hypothetical protein